MTQTTTSVLVSCKCGSQAWIAERFGGRKIRCRACGNVIRVPSRVAKGWEEPDGQRWKMHEAGEDLLVLVRPVERRPCLSVRDCMFMGGLSP